MHSLACAQSGGIARQLFISIGEFGPRRGWSWPAESRTASAARGAIFRDGGYKGRGVSPAACQGTPLRTLRGHGAPPSVPKPAIHCLYSSF
jgi:hypothetical protein